MSRLYYSQYNRPLALANRDKEIARRYAEGEKVSVLVSEYKLYRNDAVASILRKLGIPRRPKGMPRKCALDETVFDTITDESAYWIGFFITDGSITHSNNSNILSLASKDIEHIYKYRDFLKSTHKVYHYKGKYAQLVINSKKLVDELLKYGVTPRKSFSAQVCKNLENNSHFWRGAVDGDGCIFINKTDGRIGITFCGSKNLCTQFLNYIKAIVPDCKASVRWANSPYVVTVYGKYAIPVLKSLYGDSTIYLDRKYNMAMDILSRSAINGRMPYELD